jgi:DNA-binding transcriptional MerR regulator
MGHTHDVKPADPRGDDIAMSVAGAAAFVGLTPATLRTWDRRYGMSPSIRTTGGHRRYNANDLTRLRLAAKLVDSGLPPAGAATAVVAWSIAECQQRLDEQSVPSPEGEPDAAGGQRPGGGRSISMPRATSEQRGLSRAALTLDAQAVRDIMTSAIESRGVVRAWEELAAPILIAIGNRWELTREAVEVEHVASLGIQQALEIPVPDNMTGRPVLLCCSPEEQHGLALLALRAALIESGTPAVMLGTRMPAEGLVAAAGRLRPRAIVLWASLAENADSSVLSLLPNQRPPIKAFVAGPGWPLTEDVQHATHLSSLAEAVNLLRL